MKVKMNPKVQADRARLSDGSFVEQGQVIEVTKKVGDELCHRPWKRTRFPLFIETKEPATPIPEPEKELTLDDLDPVEQGDDD